MRCSRCHADKPHDAFAPSMLARGVGYCRDCRRARYAENLEAERVRSREGNRKRRSSPDVRAAELARNRQRRERIKSDPAALEAHTRRERHTQLLRLYGIGLAEYEARLSAQAGRCACCGKESGGETFRVDHDHDTGAVRGLLCHKCNAGIGMLGDSIEGITNALEYLARADDARVPREVEKLSLVSVH